MWKTIIIVACVIVAIFALVKLLPKSSKAAKDKTVDLAGKAKDAVVKGRADLDDYIESKLVG